MDYDEVSLESEYRRSNFALDLLKWTLMVLRPNDGSERKGVLVFTRFVREAEVLRNGLLRNGVSAVTVTAKTPKEERKRVVEDFKNGCVKVCTNAGAMLEGFDYPALDTVVIASPTRSLTRWCQMVGRVLRPYEGKQAWVLELSGNYRQYGKMEDMRIENLSGVNQWVVTSNGRQLTGIMN
jgi:DNA repair protein RadD